jgi:hypothetical protein
MPTLADLLASNPHGWGNSPLPFIPNQGEIRNVDDPYYGTGGPSMPAKMAYLLSGIPSAMEGIKGAREASLAGDPLKTAGNVAQVALSALPASGRAMAAIDTVPKMSALLMGNTLAPAIASGDISISDPADAASRKKKSGYVRSQAAESAPVALPTDNGLSPDQNAELATLQKRLQNSDWGSGAERRTIESRLNQLQGISADYARSSNAAKTEAARIAATEKAKRDANIAQDAIDAKNREDAANTPFKMAHPGISAAIPAVTSLASMLVGARMGSGNRRVLQEGLDDLGGKITSLEQMAERAFKSGDTLTASRLAQESKALQGQLADVQKKGERGIGASLLGASAIGDLGMAAPTIIDKATALPGSQLEKDTNKQFELSGDNAKTWGGRMLLGALLHGGAMEAGALGGRAYQGPIKDPIGVGAKTTSLSAMLKDGGTSEATAAQGALGDYEQSRLARETKNQRLEEAAGDAPASAPSVPSLTDQSSDHHSVRQPRNRKGRFAGPPLNQDND